MNLSFNIAEQGEGPYRPLAILRWVMVVIFVSFGMQKFTLQSAQGIAQFISNSPFVSWLSMFGLRGEAYVLGVTEFGIAVLLAAGAFSPLLSVIGSLMGVITFAVTWSFFFTTPGVVKWSLSTDPMAWNLAGEFLFKDIVLLCVCLVLLLASLPRSIVRSRAPHRSRAAHRWLTDA
ncbi:YkgB family protein [Bradyrhizobium elkanii]